MAAQAVPGQQFPPGGHHPTAPGVAPVPDSYFTESRKGEINELRNLLKGFSTERDPKKKRDIIKKVIAYMTLGIDVSRLFTEMMLAIETRDLVIKKMVYLYLTNYARTHPELAQMCTNTLQKDCGNDDPMVRGLALRALAGLGLPQMLEYIVEPVRRALGDIHAYVRKTAVMGVLKVYHMDKAAFEEAGLVDVLYDMLRDPDASVVVNCVIVLNEIMQKSPAGGMAINRAIMLHLLNRMHEFNEFAKVQILELVPRYIPANDDEAYQIMNLLDPVLRTTDSGATMATIRAFLSIAEQLGDTELQHQIVARVKAPLVTQISCGSSEIMYALLKHIKILTKMAPGIFDDEYRQFYVRYNEATYVKYEKVKILSYLANADNAPDLVAELAELVHDPNTELSRLAIQSMARIADEKGGPGAAEAIARRLVEMLDSTQEHISSEAASALTLLIRKIPSLKNLIAPPLVRSLKYVKDGKAAVIFLIAECGEIVIEAPYALEKLIDTYDDIEDTEVKLALLTATVKLFFMRPPEVQAMLGRLLQKTTADVSSQDLHDRALFYYRMLQSGVNKSVILVDTSVAGAFSEHEDDYKELIDEFNTLSIVYGKPSFKFVPEEHRVKYTKMPPEHPLQPGAEAAVAPPPPAAVSAAPSMPAAAPAAAEVDLLGFGGPPAPAPAAASIGNLSLHPSMTMTGDEYQTKWEAVPDAQASVSTVPLTSLPPDTGSLENKLKTVFIQTMASGELPNEFKFYLYAQDATNGTLFLIQSNIEKTADPLMIVTVKTFGGTGTGVDDLIRIITNALV